MLPYALLTASMILLMNRMHVSEAELPALEEKLYRGISNLRYALPQLTEGRFVNPCGDMKSNRTAKWVIRSGSTGRSAG